MGLRMPETCWVVFKWQVIKKTWEMVASGWFIHLKIIPYYTNFAVRLAKKVSMFFWTVIFRPSSPFIAFLWVNFLSARKWFGWQITGRDSVVGIANCYGLEGLGFKARWGTRFSAPGRTGHKAHAASGIMGTGALSRGKSGRDVAFTIHSHVVPKLPV